MALPEYTDGVLELYRIENDESEDIRKKSSVIPECAFGIVSLRYMTPPEQSYPLTASK